MTSVRTLVTTKLHFEQRSQIVEARKSICFISLGDIHGLKYQVLSEDLLISYRYACVYPHQLRQSLSTELDKDLMNGLS